MKSITQKIKTLFSAHTLTYVEPKTLTKPLNSRNSFTSVKTLCLAIASLCTVTAYADEGHAIAVDPKVPKLFEELTTSIDVQLDEQKLQEVYDNFCPKNAEIQSKIDYFLIKSKKQGANLSKIPENIPFNSEAYTDGSKRVSFPLDDYYNYFFLIDEGGSYHNRVKNSYPFAPLYNMTKEKNGKPNGEVLLVLPAGFDDHFLGVDTANYQNNCKTDNFCNDKNQLDNLKPFRTMLLVHRTDDGECSFYKFKSDRLDIQNLQSSVYIKNEIDLYAPHGNNRFEIADKNWISTNKNVKGYFTYELNKLTINGTEYKMIPGGKVFGTSVWYLKGKGELHEKWLYMYPTADVEKLYCDKPECKKADRVVVTIFHNDRAGLGANEYDSVLRYSLYPDNSKKK